MEYTIKGIFEVLRKRWRIILFFTLIGLCAFYIGNRFIRTSTYTSSVQLYVIPGDAENYGDLNGLNYAQKVVTTYINFLKTNVFFQRVVEDTSLNYEVSDLKRNTQIYALGNTEIFEMKITTHSQEDTYYLAEAMERIAPRMIKSIKPSAELRVVDPVLYPAQPSGPNLLLNTVAGGLLGVLIAVSASLIWEIFDVKVKNKDELIKKYEKPILGEIPSMDVKKTRVNQIKEALRRRFRREKYIPIEEDLEPESNFMIIEAYKALRANLRYILRKADCKKIIINSPTPEDGKSTTCINLGITIAQTGMKVLIIDCDLRRGRIHGAFHLKNYPGLSDVLSGMIPAREAIQRTEYDNLSVLTMGALAPNPAELLSSLQMEELITSLEKDYDYILMDSPPVNIVSDSLGLIKQVDGVLLVVREKNTTHPNIYNAIAQYKLVEANLMGMVLNDITVKQGKKIKSKYYYNHKND